VNLRLSLPLIPRPRTLPVLLTAVLLGACASRPPAQFGAASFPMPNLPPPRPNGAIFHAGYDQGFFGDPTAHNVGDTVTVLLDEVTTAQNSSQTDTSKTTKDSLSAPSLFGLPMTIHGSSFLSGTINNGNTFAGAGGSKQSDSLVGAIQVTVVKRLPNGNLVIRGQTLMQINQADEYVRLEGVIRPVDISPANTISSQQVADARIAYGQTGPLNDANSPGLLSRFFNLPWLPF
jgi:flagellar L-ring protein precursor FlgH